MYYLTSVMVDLYRSVLWMIIFLGNASSICSEWDITSTVLLLNSLKISSMNDSIAFGSSDLSTSSKTRMFDCFSWISSCRLWIAIIMEMSILRLSPPDQYS